MDEQKKEMPKSKALEWKELYEKAEKGEVGKEEIQGVIKDAQEMAEILSGFNHCFVMLMQTNFINNPHEKIKQHREAMEKNVLELYKFLGLVPKEEKKGNIQ